MIRYNRYKHVILLHVLAFFGHPWGGIQQTKNTITAQPLLYSLFVLVITVLLICYITATFFCLLYTSQWLKKAKTCRRITTCLYLLYLIIVQCWNLYGDLSNCMEHEYF